MNRIANKIQVKEPEKYSKTLVLKNSKENEYKINVKECQKQNKISL